MQQFSLFFLLLCMSFLPCAIAQELPLVKSYTKIDYPGKKQNWDIDQLSNGLICIANSGGLLTFDGYHWRQHVLPHNQILRTIEVKQDTIFAGAFGEFGYWYIDSTGLGLSYKSMNALDSLLDFEQDEVWNIVVDADQVYGQSFGRVFKKQGDLFQTIYPPNSIRYIYGVSGSLALQVNGRGIFQLVNDSIDEISKPENLLSSRIKGIIAYDDEHWLLATEHQGLYLYDQIHAVAFETEIDELLKEEQINKVIQLRSGHYAIGTILNGLYIIDSDGKLIFHFNKEAGLTNNTILALFEDQAGNLWVGLDDGLAVIEVESPIQYWKDYTGELGTPYIAKIFANKLFVGTNHGLFFRPLDDRGPAAFVMVPGTQGQVWDLCKVGTDLFCGHNVGLLRISTSIEIEQITSGSGIYSLHSPPSAPDKLILGTYNGISVITRDSLAMTYSELRTDFEHGARWLLTDPVDSGLWVASPFKGVSRIYFNDSYSEIQRKQSFDGDLPANARWMPETIGESMTVVANRQLYQFDRESGAFVPFQNQHTEQSSFMKTISSGGSIDFYVHDRFVQLIENKRVKASLSLVLEESSRSIFTLGHDQYFFCLDEGYAILQDRNGMYQEPAWIPCVRSVQAFDKSGKLIKSYELLEDVHPNVVIPSKTSRLRLEYANNSYLTEHQFQFQLVGFDEGWSPWELSSSKEYTNLSAGDYSFRLATHAKENNKAIQIVVLPKWYETVVARLGFAALCMLSVAGIYMIYIRRIERHKRRLRIENERILNRELLVMRTKQLEHDVIIKSKELANSTMNLVQKNEVLNSILTSLREVKEGLGIRFPQKYYQNLVRLIKRNLSERDDWRLFETNFNQVHDDFFTQLRKDYPQLTAGELKLAAYLKMNLSTKEIAQLLKISTRGVENKRYRLRKKLSLEHDDNLVTHLMDY